MGDYSHASDAKIYISLISSCGIVDSCGEIIL
jgi:hypothetical protein